MTEDQKLDNPAWYSLAETHAPLSLRFSDLLCYLSTVCPFAGYRGNPKEAAPSLSEFARKADAFFVIGDKPACPDELCTDRELVCLQMVMEHPPDIRITEEIVPLNTRFGSELVELVNRVQPGYFLPGTVQMGAYFGIFKEGRLVAVTGERMKMNGFTENSAVVTHPEHTGKGYAKQLMAHTMDKISREGRVAYLHVAESNTAAITLYQRTGFRTRRKISFWHFITR